MIISQEKLQESQFEMPSELISAGVPGVVMHPQKTAFASYDLEHWIDSEMLESQQAELMIYPFAGRNYILFAKLPDENIITTVTGIRVPRTLPGVEALADGKFCIPSERVTLVTGETVLSGVEALVEVKNLDFRGNMFSRRLPTGNPSDGKLRDRIDRCQQDVDGNWLSPSVCEIVDAQSRTGGIMAPRYLYDCTFAIDSKTIPISELQRLIRAAESTWEGGQYGGDDGDDDLNIVNEYLTVSQGLSDGQAWDTGHDRYQNMTASRALGKIQTDFDEYLRRRNFSVGNRLFQGARIIFVDRDCQYKWAAIPRASYLRIGTDVSNYIAAIYQSAPDRSLVLPFDSRMRRSSSSPHRLGYHSVDRQNKGGQSTLRCGIEIEKEDMEVLRSLDAHDIYRKTGGWIVERDGSLDEESGFELISPILPLDEESVKKEFEAYPELRKMIDSKYSTSRCGGHIHLSDRRRNPNVLFDALSGYYPLLYAMYPTRARSGKYCHAQPKDAYPHGRVQGGNKGAIRKTEHTLEIRIFPSPKSLSVLLTRIRLLKFMMENPEPDFNDVLGKLLDENSKLYQLMRTFYGKKRIAERAVEAAKFAMEIDRLTTRHGDGVNALARQLAGMPEDTEMTTETI
jgi:hypothetical protein